MSINRLMNTGVRAMQNNQVAIRTTGHNIANANTEGYSRQDASCVAQKPIQQGSLLIGDGAEINRIRRSHDDFLSAQINKESETFGMYKERSALLGSVESIFNEASDDAFSNSMSKMFNSFRQVSANPENTALRTAVLESVKGFVNSTNTMGNNLNKVQENINSKIDATATQINSMAKEIATLNENIGKMEIHGNPANDLRDRRDLLVKNLSKIVDIQTSEDTSTGMLSITIAGAASLVTGPKPNTLTIERASNNAGAIIFNLVVKSASSSMNITKNVKKGELAGMLNVRDSIIPEFRDKMEALVYGLSNKMNEIHSKSYDLTSETNNKLFDAVLEQKNILSSIKLSKDVAEQPKKLAIASRPFEPANNEGSLEMSALQNSRFLSENTATAGDVFGSLVSTIGIKTNEANSMAKHQSAVLNQLDTFRDSISGVSLDEEAIDLVKYQKAFEASARVIKVADELLETIMNIKRV